MLLIARREWLTLFSSPFGWCLVATIVAALGGIFFFQLRYFLNPPPESVLLPELWGVTRVAVMPMFHWGAFLVALAIPLLTMRQLSDEYRLRTLPLLLSSPLSALGIVLGKVLASAAVTVGAVILALLPIVVLAPSTSLDVGLIASGLIAIGLLSLSVSALGVWLSSFTSNAALAGVCTLGFVLVSWLLGARPPADIPHWLGLALSYVSWQHHLESLLRGTLTTPPIVFFASVFAFSVFFATRRVKFGRRHR
ncbi:MAG: ABC transporter permease subunit [Pseudomonadota bacterium]